MPIEMGLLVDGVWRDQWYDTDSSAGRFERSAAAFRHWITPDGSAGPSGEAGFAAEAGRYHLYVSLACPWAHRTLIVRALKGLGDLIPLSVVHWFMGDKGWTFQAAEGVVPDPNEGAEALHQLYTRADPHYSGRVTVPVLWDKDKRTIVSNESSEIIRMFNSAFDHLGARDGNFYPAALREEIDRLNERIYRTVNNGVYRCGFATTQEAYEEALDPLFASLDWLDGSWPAGVICWAPCPPRRTGACSPRWCVSTRSMWGISSATSGGWSITATCSPTAAISTRCQGWRQR